MSKDPIIFLQHILESIEWIEKDTADFSEEDFHTNVPIQDAVVRRLEIIGEAIKNLPEDFKSNNNEVAWQDISDMRNQLIHHYFGVDLNAIWQVVKRDIPQLKIQIQRLLNELQL